MTNEQKQLLLKDLCARLPYGVMVQVNGVFHDSQDERLGYVDCYNNQVHIHGYNFGIDIDNIKPYLRPMSSMTEKEAKNLVILWGIVDFVSLNITKEYIGVICDDGFSSTTTTEIWYDEDMSIECYDFLNAHHFDYRGLIEQGLAIEAPEGMYDAFTDTSTQSSNNCNKIVMDL